MFQTCLLCPSSIACRRHGCRAHNPYARAAIEREEKELADAIRQTKQDIADVFKSTIKEPS